MVYAYRRADYLRAVLADLRVAEGISETLLIVSHDGLFKDVFDAVAGGGHRRSLESALAYSLRDGVS